MRKIGILFLWTWGAFHLLRNSENSSWDVDGTHVFRAFHWKVPGNNWNFKKGSPSCFPVGNFRWKSMFHLRVFTRNHRQFQAIQARRYLCYHLEFWWRTHKRMELVSNGTHSSLDGPFHGSFRKFLVKRLWTLVNGDNRHLILAQPRDSRRKPTLLMRALHSHFRAVLRLSILFGRHGPNRVIEFACFDSKLQWARNTCESKQAKRRECLLRGVSQHSIYLQFSKSKYPFKWAFGLIHVLSTQIFSKISEKQS